MTLGVSQMKKYNCRPDFCGTKARLKVGSDHSPVLIIQLVHKTSACVDRVVSVDCSAAIETDEFAWGLRAALQVDNHPVV